MGVNYIEGLYEYTDCANKKLFNCRVNQSTKSQKVIIWANLNLQKMNVKVSADTIVSLLQLRIGVFGGCERFRREAEMDYCDEQAQHEPRPRLQRGQEELSTDIIISITITISCGLCLGR